MGLHLSPAPLSRLTLAAAIAALAIGIPAATRVEQESGGEDPGHVVIDEVAGQWIALIHSRVNLSHLLAGFLFFRLFDIVKPWPARQLEGLPGGWGIMLDDVAAGVYALLLVQALQHWIG
jgi:phosphatidylglycerophosphatase A